MATKGDIAAGAFEDLVISGITSKPSPEEVVSAITQLDNMVNSWKNKNICLSYTPSVSYGATDPNQDSGLADSEIFAAIKNLAKKLCPSFGKQCPMEISADAKDSLEGLYSIVLPTKETRPYLPTGAGETYSYYNSLYHGFYNKYFPYEPEAPDNCSTFEIKTGEIDSYSVDFNQYLLDGNSITSYTIEDGQGVTVLNSAEVDGIITMECQGGIEGYSPVLITVTTSAGRVNPESVNFNVISNPQDNQNFAS